MTLTGAEACAPYTKRHGAARPDAPGRNCKTVYRWFESIPWDGFAPYGVSTTFIASRASKSW
jgi:hypothetical protein